MKARGTVGQRLNTIVAATVNRQKTNEPVAEWELAKLEEIGAGRHNYFKISQYMQTDVISVQPDESAYLVANLMEWERLRHIPVESSDNKLVGLISYRSVLRLVTRPQGDNESISVEDIMIHDPITVGPDTSTVRAIEIMRQYQIGCLPVVHDGRLVGIVTEGDFMDIAADLMELKSVQ